MKVYKIIENKNYPQFEGATFIPEDFERFLIVLMYGKYYYYMTVETPEGEIVEYKNVPSAVQL